MKTPVILHLAAFGAAFIIPNDQVSNLQHVEIQRHPRPSGLKSDFLSRLGDLKDRIVGEVQSVYEQTTDKVEEFEITSKHTLEEAFTVVEETNSAVIDRVYETYFDVEGWLESFLKNDGVVDQLHTFDDPSHDEPPHHGPPGDHPPHHDPPPHDGHPPHHGPPHHREKSNLTVYQLISKSNYTTKLVKLINKYDDLVEALNSTGVTNFTVFAPTDRAFAKIPEHAPEPSEAQLKALLQYHVSGEFYPAGRILVSRTIPTLYIKDTLGDKPHPQRLSTNIGPRGLTVNFYSRVVAVDIFGTNGVIHGVDSLLIPPPKIIKIIDLLPSEFSTLALGLSKTGLYEDLNSTDVAHTFFAPSNFAFQKLGPRINAFLFSSYGLKYLKALLQYHVVANQVLYSDAFYGPSSSDMLAFNEPKKGGCHSRRDGEPHRGPPKGFFHVDLPTLLDDYSLSIDIARYGRLIDIKINGFNRVVVSDGVAQDGVIHVVGDVLIPPKKLPGVGSNSQGEMTVEELKERLSPFVEHNVDEIDDESWRDL